MRNNLGRPMHKARPDTVRYLRSMGLTIEKIASVLEVSATTIQRATKRGEDGQLNGVLRCKVCGTEGAK